MGRPDALTPLQVEVARIFFELKVSASFLVAGGAALLASDLITRPTEDLDLFASSPVVAVADAQQELVEALEQRDHEVSLIQDSPTFCRMIVRGAEEEILVDLAIDSPPHSASAMTILGPTLAPIELAGRKLLALFGRAEARDFADVYLLVQRFGKDALLKEAASLDAGFDHTVLAQMMGTLGRFADDKIPLEQADMRDRHRLRSGIRECDRGVAHAARDRPACHLIPQCSARWPPRPWEVGGAAPSAKNRP